MAHNLESMTHNLEPLVRSPAHDSHKSFLDNIKIINPIKIHERLLLLLEKKCIFARIIKYNETEKQCKE
jgi:hypothetical protein